MDGASVAVNRQANRSQGCGTDLATISQGVAPMRRFPRVSFWRADEFSGDLQDEESAPQLITRRSSLTKVVRVLPYLWRERYFFAALHQFAEPRSLSPGSVLRS
jgi:hypothetical protein